MLLVRTLLVPLQLIGWCVLRLFIPKILFSVERKNVKEFVRTKYIPSSVLAYTPEYAFSRSRFCLPQFNQLPGASTVH